MLLRATAVAASILVHLVLGCALWPRLQEDKLNVLDLGTAQDIVLMPLGLALSETRRLGEDVKSEAIESQPLLKTLSASPPLPLRDAVDDVHDQKAQDVAAPVEEQPTASVPIADPAEHLPDVIASEKSTIPMDTVKVTEALPELIVIPSIAGRGEPQLGQLNESSSRSNPIEDAKFAARVVTQEASVLDQVHDKAIASIGASPAPETLKSQSSSDQTSAVALEPLEDLKSQTMEAVSHPQSVAIVTEKNSEKAKSSDAANVVDAYLDAINDRVQQFKFNARSGVTGTVVLQVKVGFDGALLSTNVVVPSGSLVLDGVAVTTLNRAAPFPPIPKALNLKTISFTLPFNFVSRAP